MYIYNNVGANITKYIVNMIAKQLSFLYLCIIYKSAYNNFEQT